MRVPHDIPVACLHALVAFSQLSCTVDVPDLRSSNDGPDASDGAAGSLCPTGLADCDGTPSSCETSTSDDGTNCGACRHDCLGGQCVAGKCRPVVLTIPESHPYQLVLSTSDGTGDLYWTCESCGDYGVWKAANDLSSSGGFAPVAITGAKETTMGLSLSAYEVYWAEYLTGEVRRIAKVGGVPYALSTGLAPGTLDVATDGNHLYLTGTNGRISRISVNVAGAPTEDLVGGLSLPRSIALDGDRMYWCDVKAKKVMRAGKDGSGVCDIAGTVFNPRSLVVESPWVYWREGEDVDGEGRVMKARDGCPSPEVVELATGQGGPRYLALHDDHVYYTILSGSVRRLPKAGGSWEELYKSAEDAHGIAVDDRAVYWTSWGAGKVYRLAH